eukprot:TRINITY_DN866_c0_g2_i1.p1 TRINITY_DN866_c0_g2~~TRINITY_DN866_c0_g2_i1.p1  ORF type:complete len:621 (+),score=115.54 TRINITY_DN866_c0_g2_i1:125-1987(+)
MNLNTRMSSFLRKSPKSPFIYQRTPFLRRVSFFNSNTPIAFAPLARQAILAPRRTFTSQTNPERLRKHLEDELHKDENKNTRENEAQELALLTKELGFKVESGFQFTLAAILLAALTTSAFANSEEEKSAEKKDHSQLPFYTRQEVAKHKTEATGIWVIYQGGVYDVTNFVENHPGGKAKIMLAAGGSVEPFWKVYKMHQSEHIREILEEYRIGNLVPSEISQIEEAESSEGDLFSGEPARVPFLVVRSEKPFNAETPPELLVTSFVTPNPVFYVRSHMATPLVNSEEYKLQVTGEGLSQPISFTLDQLKSFPKHTVVTTIQCAGNRRSEFQKLGPVHGLPWGTGAVGTAVWSGVKLKDLLLHAGYDINNGDVRHVQFEGLDNDKTNNYGASIPVEKALSDDGDVIIAYEMNGEEIPRDHGYPVRAVVPGVVGARNVKWLGKIVTAKEESPSFWQQKDYKLLPPYANTQKLDTKDFPSIQELPVTSVICEPLNQSSLSPDQKELTLKGYAYSGGGRGIVRVEVSGDCGQTWRLAKLTDEKEAVEDNEIGGVLRKKSKYFKNWAWTLWEITIPVPEGGGDLRVCCRAMDSSGNIQPESLSSVTNTRGFCCNALHCINLQCP